MKLPSVMGTKETTLTTNTRITFALLAMICSPMLAGIVLWFKMEAMQQEMRQAWSVPQQVVWSVQLGAMNPNLQIPPVEGVIKLVNQRE